MGGGQVGGLNILPKKRWHVRTRENIARVRRDEAKAEEEEKQRLERAAQAEKEARTAFLRGKAAQRRQREGIPSNSNDNDDYANLSRQDQPSSACVYGGRVVQEHAAGSAQSGRNPAVSLSTDSGKMQDNKCASVLGRDGHVNLFAEVEEEKRNNYGANKDAEREKKAERELEEQKVGLLKYLGQGSVEASESGAWYAKVPMIRTSNHQIQSNVRASDQILSRFLNKPQNLSTNQYPIASCSKMASKEVGSQIAKPRIICKSSSSSDSSDSSSDSGEDEWVEKKPDHELNSKKNSSSNRRKRRRSLAGIRSSGEDSRQNRRKRRRKESWVSEKKQKKPKYSSSGRSRSDHKASKSKKHSRTGKIPADITCTLAAAQGSNISSSRSHAVSDPALQKLRAERLLREREERFKTQQLLNKLSGIDSPNVVTKSAKTDTEPAKQRYNSQFNPDICRQNQNRAR